MRKGEWLLFADEEGVRSLARIEKVDWAADSVEYTVYAKAFNYESVLVDDSRITLMLHNIAAAKQKGADITRVPAKTARNLLKLLQRKTK